MNEARGEVIREHEPESADSFIGLMCLKIISNWGSLSKKPQYELVRIDVGTFSTFHLALVSGSHFWESYLGAAL
jgi:hypothetical protein